MKWYYIGLAGEDRRVNEEERRRNEEEKENEEEDENEREDEDEERSRDNDDDEIPEQLRSYSNVLEICNWLVDKRPDILNLASQMLEAKKSVSLLPSDSSGGPPAGPPASSSTTQQVHSVNCNSCL